MGLVDTSIKVRPLRYKCQVFLQEKGFAARVGERMCCTRRSTDLPHAAEKGYAVREGMDLPHAAKT